MVTITPRAPPTSVYLLEIHSAFFLFNNPSKLTLLILILIWNFFFKDDELRGYDINTQAIQIKPQKVSLKLVRGK